MAAAAMMVGCALLIGFTDNGVRVIAESAGLWQFHATRSVMAAVMLAGAAAFGLRLRPRNWRAVVARSGLHGVAMLMYFSALGFLSVAQVAAGIFSAPIFVLLINRFAFGQRITGLQAGAVALGFAGVVMVLGPAVLEGASLAALIPVLAGAFYALANIATRVWCADEAPGTLLAGFFAALGLFGAIGMAVLTAFPLPVLPGADGWVLRGPAVPDAGFWIWTFIQAAGSLLGVGLMIRAYQLAETAKVAVFEYAVLPAAALWTWIIWGQGVGWSALLGMAAIAAAGTIIARGGRAAAA